MLFGRGGEFAEVDGAGVVTTDEDDCEESEVITLESVRNESGVCECARACV